MNAGLVPEPASAMAQVWARATRVRAGRQQLSAGRWRRQQTAVTGTGSWGCCRRHGLVAGRWRSTMRSTEYDRSATARRRDAVVWWSEGAADVEQLVDSVHFVDVRCRLERRRASQPRRPVRRRSFPWRPVSRSYWQRETLAERQAAWPVSDVTERHDVTRWRHGQVQRSAEATMWRSAQRCSVRPRRLLENITTIFHRQILAQWPRKFVPNKSVGPPYSPL